MVRLRKLAAKIRTDPWLADSTTVPQFDIGFEIRRFPGEEIPEI